jgi:NADH-ubiquinone oxidoreductase chain 5
LFPLIFGSIFVGFIFKDMVIGVGTLFWQNALFVMPLNLCIFDAEFLPQSTKMVPVCFSFMGIFLAVLLYGILPLTNVYRFKMSFLGQYFYNFFNRKWFFDKVYNEFINQKVLNLGFNVTYKVIDRGLIENLGPHGLNRSFYHKDFNFLKIQTGLLYHYTFVMLIGCVCFITLVGFISVISFKFIWLFLITFFMYSFFV